MVHRLQSSASRADALARVRAVSARLLALVVGLAASASARWELLESGDDGFMARWSTVRPVIDTMWVDGRVTLRLTIEDGATDGDAGSPAIPLVSRLIALPEGMDAAASVSVGAAEPYEGWLAPVPRSEPLADGTGYRLVYRTDRDAYARTHRPPRLALEEAGTASGMRLVRLRLAPVQFDPAERQIDLARSITVVVRYTGGPALMTRAPGLPSFWRDAVLNFDQARRWAPATPRQRPAAPGSFFENATWMRIIVNDPGVYYLTADTVIGVDQRFRDAPLAHLAMFSGPARELPISPTAQRPQTFATVRPLIADVNGDGKFNGKDSVVFYGNGPSGWHQNMGGLYDVYFETNRYTTENVYWLAVIDTTARHGEVVDGMVTNPDAPGIDRYYFRHHEESEWRNFDEVGGSGSDGLLSGLDWEWDVLPAQQTRTVQPTLYDMAGDTVVLRIGQLKQGYEGRRFVLSAKANGAAGSSLGQGSYGAFGFSQDIMFSVPASDQLNLSVSITNPASPSPIGAQYSTAHLDFYDVSHWRKLVVRGDALEFTVQPGRYIGADRPARVLLNGIDLSRHRLFEVTDSVGLVEYRLPPADKFGVTGIQVTQSGLLERRFVVTAPTKWRRPARLEAVASAPNLRGRTGGLDYIVIAHPGFVSDARRLADWRVQHDGLRTLAVSTQDIYDEFSFGLFDPVAIRDFIRYAWEYWRDGPSDEGLQYVLLMGDGQYDFRNLSRAYSGQNDPHPGNWVPTYQDGDVTTDDWFGVFGQGVIPSVRIGRLCVQTKEEAKATVDKIIAYDREPERGSWQNRIIMVSDDEFNSDYDWNTETVFVQDSEYLVRLVRSETVVRKIYSFQYPMNEQGLRPGANRAIVDAWNEGAALLNYIGHGSPVGWAHERIFILGDELPQIRNGNRLPVLIALTCSAAHFDDPKRQSMAEALVNLRGGGVIASVAATRLVNNPDNVFFMKEFLPQFYSLGGRRPTIGDAFWRSKVITLASGSRIDNSRRFTLVGDPATRVALPELPVRAAIDLDSLAALRPVTIAGSVLTADGRETLRSFDGTALVDLFDSQTPGVWRAASGSAVPYARIGTGMFRGMATVSGGEFTIKAILPREVVYGGRAARVVAQVWNEQIDGAGSLDSIAISTTVGPDNGDVEGPAILFTRAGNPDEREPLVDGTEIAPGEPVRVWLSDPSGINVTAAIGHRLLAYINEGRDSPVDLTRDFVHWGSATTGWVEINLPSDTRANRIVVEAWDNRNNFAADSVFVRTGRAPGIALMHVIAYPNPMADQTTFTWIAEGIGTDTQADVTVRVYTVAGRLVDTVSLVEIADGPVLVPWRPARQLANGVYLYHITVRRRSDGNTARIIERLAVVSR